MNAKIGVSVSWVVQSKNKTLMQMWFIHWQWETCLLLLPEIHIFIPAISVPLPKQPYIIVSASAPAWVYEERAYWWRGWGEGGGCTSGFYISISFNISTARSPCVLCLSLLPPERDCLADSPKRGCAKWTWQIPGWLHMARPELHVPGIPKLLSPY